MTIEIKQLYFEEKHCVVISLQTH